jgi:hypothetical protein
MTFKTKTATLVACMLAICVALTPQRAGAVSTPSATPTITPTATPTATPSFCSGSPQQGTLPRPIPLGISGGNIRSMIINKKGKDVGCFSGTLGSMVQDSADNQYILSNNHVLADQNMAKPGQAIVQPGLADLECLQAPGNSVATFSSKVKIKFESGKNNVDAAMAAVQPGDVLPQILFIGDISGTVDDSPTLAMPVQKMGRTTCLTTGSIQALAVDITVDYSFNPRKPKLAKFVNQMTFAGTKGALGAAGDSGSLILTTESCPRAVALLFAGGPGGLTFGNPISAVLSGLGVTMVGTCTDEVTTEGDASDVSAAEVGVSKEVVASTKAVRDRHEDQLMSIPGAVGSGIAAGDQPGQAAIDVYVEKLTPQASAAAPRDVEGTPVNLIESGHIVAY